MFISLLFPLQALVAGGKEKVGTEVYNRVLLSHNTAQLNAVLYEYLQLADCDLEDTITRDTSGHYRDGLLALGHWLA